MHPAKSVIFFTTLSGAGYGLFIAMAISAAFGWTEPNLSAAGLSFILIVAGLISSTFHLGHPERAWRALSQWRTSWLSREGVLAILTFIPMGLYVLSGWMPVIGWIAVALCIMTVFATAMIYQSLKPVHAWYNNHTIGLYLRFAITTGLLLFCLFNQDMWLRGITIGFMFFTGFSLFLYWRFLDDTASESTPESATGLGKFGQVNLFEAPHTESNYLMQEMGFKIARKHSRKLRMIFFVLWLCAATLTGLSILIWPLALSAAAVALAFTATLIQRWLFFAEAKHTVSLYYGAESA